MQILENVDQESNSTFTLNLSEQEMVVLVRAFECVEIPALDLEDRKILWDMLDEAKLAFGG